MKKDFLVWITAFDYNKIDSQYRGCDENILITKKGSTMKKLMTQVVNFLVINWWTVWWKLCAIPPVFDWWGAHLIIFLKKV